MTTVNRDKSSIEVDGVLRTVKVFVRHSADCKHAEKGSGWAGCNCRKSLLCYDGTTQKQQITSAKTRSWQAAEEKASEWLDQFDPTKREQSRQAAQAVSIEVAAESYLKDMKARGIKEGTLARNRTLLVSKLNAWLAAQSMRPLLISEFTPAHVTAWRASWTSFGDLTAAISFDAMKTFFKFCVGQGWILISPAANVKRPKVQRGNRTATFTDEQYDAILAKAKEQRIHTFLELLRWSGMAILDAACFERKLVGDDGVLRYTRMKTHTLATVKLPDHVVALLRSVEGGEKPFYRSDVTEKCLGQEWRRALQDLFKAAGIKKVMTVVGRSRKPHPHMLRDTCAVWYLRHGMSLHGVSKVLGHADPTITAKHYMPFVKELEQAHIAENTAILEAAKPKSGRNVVVLPTAKSA